MRASNTAELVFENCKVPVENIVGSEGGAVLCMMRNLEIERVTLAAMSLGIARRSLEVMSNYAKEREAFGRPLNNFGQIQKNIAESYAEYMAGRALGGQPRGHGRREALLRRHGEARRGPRHPDAGRLRLRGRVQRGAPVARLEAAGDRRRHERVPPQEHGAGPRAEPGVLSPSERPCQRATTLAADLVDKIWKESVIGSLQNGAIFGWPTHSVTRP
ncbi:hypothetical protein ON010_g18512 [Phytophthora cinnamomi]|nr:hypothetical protein ON010_g18512 [Phytophthora cinnamomi]